MNDKPCPLCGREMTTIETYAGRGELYCGHCDLVIGSNEPKTPYELMALLEQRTCRNISDPPSGFLCSECGWGDFNEPTHLLKDAKHCPNCGRRITKEVTE